MCSIAETSKENKSRPAAAADLSFLVLTVGYLTVNTNAQVAFSAYFCGVPCMIFVYDHVLFCLLGRVQNCHKDRTKSWHTLYCVMAPINCRLSARSVCIPALPQHFGAIMNLVLSENAW